MFEQYISNFEPQLQTESLDVNSYVENNLFDEIFNDIFGRTLCRGKKNEKKSDDKNAILGEKKI
jgi:hypothetical protein